MNVTRSATSLRKVLRTVSKNYNCLQNRNSYSFLAVEYANWSRQSCSSSSNSSNIYNRTIGCSGYRFTSARHFRSSAVASKQKNFYDILGVGKTASKDEIKSKYREMAKKCHPDLNRDDKSAEERFKEITAAYEVLENDSKRQTYDSYGFDGLEYEESGRTSGRNQNNGGFQDFNGFGFQVGDDIFSMFHDMAERDNGRQGKDVSIKLKLTFLEAVLGCSKEVQFEIGSTQQKSRRGKQHKTESKTKTVDVKIPAGVDTGMTVQLDGQGYAAKKGNHVGNLVIELVVEKDKYFRREKSDVYTDLHISIDQAILGTFADVRTLDGDVTMRINAGTQPGNTFSISGKGISKVNSSSSKRGNHYVQVKVLIPTVISERQKELLLEFVKEGAIKKEGIESDC